MMALSFFKLLLLAGIATTLGSCASIISTDKECYEPGEQIRVTLFETKKHSSNCNDSWIGLFRAKDATNLDHLGPSSFALMKASTCGDSEKHSDDPLSTTGGTLELDTNDLLALEQQQPSGGGGPYWKVVLLVNNEWQPYQGIAESEVFQVTAQCPTAKALEFSPAVRDLQLQNASSNVIFSAEFETDSDGFVYRDDAFRNTKNPAHASGEHVIRKPSSRGMLKVKLGSAGVAANNGGLSGGWERTLTLKKAVSLTLSFRFKLTQTAGYQDDELSQALVSIDGKLFGQPPYDMLAQLVGGTNSNSGKRTTGWKRMQIDIGKLKAGSHSLILGGFNNKKTSRRATTKILFDNISLVVNDGPEKDQTAGPREAVNRLDLKQFKGNIETLAGFGDRTQGSASYNKAASWVKDELEGAGYVVEEHFYTFGGSSRSSMYVTKIGTTYPDRMFIVSAHLDGRGGGGGADDDASGCSLVLEIARMLGSPDVRTEISVRMVFWNNEETGLNGSTAYTRDRKELQGKQSAQGSRLYPEPTWLGMIQHDMILFDHGLPPKKNQIADADIDIEYQADSVFGEQSQMLAKALMEGNQKYADSYPAEVGRKMSSTDSVPFQDLAPSVSLRENQRLAEIGKGSQPHWHQETDVFATYSDADYRFGFNVLQTTAGTVSELVGLRITS